MQSPPRTDPPYVPIRHTAWPTRKTPRWLLAAGLLVLAAGVVVGIAVHPSRSQRAADLNGFLTDMKTDIQSCAGGVRDSLTAMRAIDAGTEHDVGTAVGIATYGRSNCSRPNSMQMDDLVGYQVQESLSSFRLDRVDQRPADLGVPLMRGGCRTTWPPSCARRARPAQPRTTKLNSDLKVLDAQRAYLDKIMMAAISATGASGRPPPLPG